MTSTMIRVSLEVKKFINSKSEGITDTYDSVLRRLLGMNPKKVARKVTKKKVAKKAVKKKATKKAVKKKVTKNGTNKKSPKSDKPGAFKPISG